MIIEDPMIEQQILWWAMVFGKTMNESDCKPTSGRHQFDIPTRYPNGLPDLTPGQGYHQDDAER